MTLSTIVQNLFIVLLKELVMHLPVRIFSLPYESVFSYLVRFCQGNCLDLLTVWNYCKPKHVNYATRNYIGVLNFSPMNIIDLEKLSDLTDLSVEEILKMSFHNLLKKFTAGDDETSHSKVMTGMLHSEYHYCQKCLQETPYHQYIWSLKHVDMCYKHKTQLQHFCGHCRRTIKLKDLSWFDMCPYCGCNLAEDMVHANLKSFSIDKQEWLINNLTYLNKSDWVSISYSELAMRILYVINGATPVFKQDTVYQFFNGNMETVYNLLRRARETYKQYLKLSFIIDILLKKNCTFEKLFNMEVPKDFYESVNQRKAHHEKRLTCLAPWCSKKGALIKTGTHYQRNVKGEFKYYVICRECGADLVLIPIMNWLT